MHTYKNKSKVFMFGVCRGLKKTQHTIAVADFWKKAIYLFIHSFRENVDTNCPPMVGLLYMSRSQLRVGKLIVKPPWRLVLFSQHYFLFHSECLDSDAELKHLRSLTDVTHMIILISPVYTTYSNHHNNILHGFYP